MHDTTHEYLPKKLKINRDIHMNGASEERDIYIEKAISTRYSKTIQLYNNLPEDIKSCDNFNKFKYRLQNYIDNNNNL